MATSTDNIETTELERLENVLADLSKDTGNPIIESNKKVIISNTEKALQEQKNNLQMVVYEPPIDKEIKSDIKKLLPEVKFVTSNPYERLVTDIIRNAILSSFKSTVKTSQQQLSTLPAIKGDPQDITKTGEEINENLTRATEEFKETENKTAELITEQLMKSSESEIKNPSIFKEAAKKIASKAFDTIVAAVDAIKTGITKFCRAVITVKKVIELGIAKGTKPEATFANLAGSTIKDNSKWVKKVVNEKNQATAAKDSGRAK